VKKITYTWFVLPIKDISQKFLVAYKVFKVLGVPSRELKSW